MQGRRIDVSRLPVASNVCNQLLKEVCSASKSSVAHVTMAPDNVSILHRHDTFTEIYFILGGEGVMHLGGMRTPVREGTLVKIPPKATHMLENTGSSDWCTS